ncbi:aspartate ammonia-lyase [bacterium]|nr:MAG: aspartate ammonia-lyase [bacterium]
MPSRKAAFRIEKDFLGEVKVPIKAYYGIQTCRAAKNFPISAITPKPVFIKATAIVKLASAKANQTLGLLDKKRARAIIQASQEIISGKLHNEFIVDAYQAGAGTSHNMNANEVIANRAEELLGGKRGDYCLVHPNDHVNMSQSSNDVYPTAMRLSAISASTSLINALTALERALSNKARQFDNIIKSGRTHLQDAVPIRLGQEFGAYASSIKNSAERVKTAQEALKNIGLGGTAVGTGINTHLKYAKTILCELKKASLIKDLKPAPDAFTALSSVADFIAYSGALKGLSVELIKIANDLRLLSSGPNTGIGEIKLPAVQPGSSIMPGKVNPVMAEMLSMVCFQAIGNDLTITMAGQAGQLELNVMTPVINCNILHTTELLENAVKAFTQNCVIGITADKKKCAEHFEDSAGLATVLNTFIGYEKASEVAKEALESGRTIKAVSVEKGVFTEKEWNLLFDTVKITTPGQLRRKQRRG